MTSSTSNSKKHWFMGGLIWLILLVIAAEIFMFRNPIIYGLIPSSFIGQIVDVKKRLHSQDLNKIKFLILGDSQSLDALRAPLLAEKYGLQPDEIFNLSISSAKPIDMLRFYEQEAHNMPNLKWVWIAANEHQFNNENYMEDNKFRFNATLGERLNAPRIEDKADLAFGWLFYSYGLREVWKKYPELYRAGKIPEVPKDQYTYRWGLAPNEHIDYTHFGHDYSVELADLWMKNFRSSGAQTRAMDSLVQKISEDHIQFTIIQLPKTQEFEKVMKTKYPREQKEIQTLLKGLANTYQGRCYIIPPKFHDELFRDANHVNNKGAIRILSSLPSTP